MQEQALYGAKMMQPGLTAADSEENSLRPQHLEDYIGQEKVKQNFEDLPRGGTPPGRGHGPCAALRPARPGQDHPGRHHRQRDGGADPHHQRPRHRKAGGPGRPADKPPGRGRLVHRRDPPAVPPGGGSALPGAGRLRAGYHHRQGAQRPEHPHQPAPFHPGGGPPPAPAS